MTGGNDKDDIHSINNSSDPTISLIISDNLPAKFTAHCIDGLLCCFNHFSIFVC